MRYGVNNGLGRMVLAIEAALLSAALGCTTSVAPAKEQAAAKPAVRAESGKHAEKPAISSTSDPAEAATSVPANSAPAETVSTVAASDRPAATTSGQTRLVAKPVVSEYSPGVPAVLLTSGHAELAKVGVGEVLPMIELPLLAGGGKANLETLAGPKATVVLFWTTDRWMSEMALRDLAKLPASDQYRVVGIASNTPAAGAQKMLAKSGAKFPQLLDADAATLGQLGKKSLPRIYVLDSQRHIAWFDIEYSEATSREVRQAIDTLTGAGK